MAVLNLCVVGRLWPPLRIAAGATEVRFEGLPAGEKSVEIWLSPAMPVAVRHIALPGGSTLRKKRRHSAEVGCVWQLHHPLPHRGIARHTWPGVVARARDFNLTSLGFGGQCHADPFIARLIRDLPARLYLVKIGINIYGAASLGPRAFRPAVLGTIATIRDGHPHTRLRSARRFGATTARLRPIWLA